MGGRKITAAFDGGRLSSDGGVMLLSAAARQERLVPLSVLVPEADYALGVRIDDGVGGLPYEHPAEAIDVHVPVPFHNASGTVERASLALVTF